MVGSLLDMLSRLKATLPLGWFADSTPVLDSLLSGIAAAWSSFYAQVQTVRNQTRLSTASGFGLDLIANDFFGAGLTRGGDTDEAFRSRIAKELLRPRGTRAALVSILTDRTGRPPLVFEPARPADTGAYVRASDPPAGLAYGEAGGWGSLMMPFQALVVAYRPEESGIPSASGWQCNGGGYGIGSLEYASLAMSKGQVSDASIFEAVASVLPVAATAWTRISN